MCSLKLTNWFSNQDLDLFQRLLDEPVEYGGQITKKKSGTPTFQIQRSSIVRGDKNMGVNLYPTSHNFHTHPRLFYKQEKTYSAYFSGVDIKYIISNIPFNLKRHFLVAHEGIYSIECSTEFSKLFLSVHDQRCRDDMVDYVFDVFYDLENERKDSQNILSLNSKTRIKFNKALGFMRDLDTDSLPPCFRKF
eukprot:Pgem_evm1s1952